jgi:hypothetical protein
VALAASACTAAGPPPLPSASTANSTASPAATAGKGGQAVTAITAAPEPSAGSVAGPSSATGILTSSPSLNQSVAREVYDTYVAQTARAYATKDYKAALALTGTVQWHEMDSEVLTAQANHQPVIQYKYGTPAFIVPSSSASPQIFLVSVERTATASRTLADVNLPARAQVLLLFSRAAGTSPWQLDATTQLPAGQALPKLATAPGGYGQLATLDDTTSYLARPDLVGPLQAGVVDDGPSSASSQAVASGPLTTGLYDWEKRPPAAYVQPKGDVRQWSLEGSQYDRFALRTANGGALVFYAMSLDSTTETPADLAQDVPVPAGAPISIPPEFQPLDFKPGVVPTKTMSTQYGVVFAAIDPPASATSSKIQVIGIGGGPSWLGIG